MGSTDQTKAQDEFLKLMRDFSARLTGAWRDMVEQASASAKKKSSMTLFDTGAPGGAFSNPYADPAKLQDMIADAYRDAPKLLKSQRDPDVVRSIADRWSAAYEKTLRRMFGMPEPTETERLAEQWDSFLESVGASGTGPWRGVFPNFFGTHGKRGSFAGTPAELTAIWLETYEKTLGAMFRLPKPGPLADWEEQTRRAIEAELRFLRLLADFRNHLAEATNKIVGGVIERMPSGTPEESESDALAEFRRIWIAETEKVFAELFKAGGFRSSVADMITAAADARSKIERAIAAWPMVEKTPSAGYMERVTERIDNLEKQVEELKRELSSRAVDEDDPESEQNSPTAL